MADRRDHWIFLLTLGSAATMLVSIAASEVLLWAAYALCLLLRPKAIRIPSYFIPLGVFMAATVLSLAMSADPHAGFEIVFRKFLLFPMGLLAANFVTSEARARLSYRLLLLLGGVAAALATLQFALHYRQFLASGLRIDDPTVAARATGFMSHWMTFSGEQMLVWCAAIPVLWELGKRWIVPLTLVGIGIILSFTRSVWIGAAAGTAAIAFGIPKRLLATVLIPIILVGAAASGLIYHRLSMSMEANFAPDLSRLAYLKTGILMIRAHPLFGVGPERIGPEFPSYYKETGLTTDLHTFWYGHLHNNINQIGAERGLLCLFTFFWFIFELFAGLWRILSRSAGLTRLSALSAIAALAGFLVAGFFEYNFGDSEVQIVFLFLVSLPFGLSPEPGFQESPVSAG